MTVWLTSTSAVDAQQIAQSEKQMADVSFNHQKALDWLSLNPSAYPLLVTTLSIDGTKVFVMLDTGSRYSVIDTSTARKVGMGPEPSGKTATISGDIDLSRAGYKLLEIGGFRHRGGSIFVADLGELRKRSGHAIEAIIGADLLGWVALEVDWDDNRMRLLQHAQAPSVGSRIPITFDAKTGQIITRLSINGLDVHRVEIDTGRDGAITLDRVLKAQIPELPGDVTDIAVHGLNGDTVLEDYFRVRDVGFGALHYADVPISVGVVRPPGFPPADALIGMDFLRQFNFVLDPPSGYITVLPRSQSAPKPQTTTSGIQGLYTSEGLVVHHVMLNSPAQKAGLKDGDRVCAVDGERVDASWEHSAKRAWSVGEPGTVVTLTLCDNTHISFKLTRFY